MSAETVSRTRTQAVALGRLTKRAVLPGLVGVVAGVVAWAFHGLTELAQRHLFHGPVGTAHEGMGGFEPRDLLVLGIPTLGGLVVGILIQRYAPEAKGHGTDSLIRSFHRMKGVVRRRVIGLKALTSAITIGTGGSAGQEGPVAQVGAGVGSALADSLKLGDRDRRILLLAGASAGVGAMFGAPLGGALFGPEVLYRKAEFEGDAMVPCITASILGYTTFAAIAGQHRAVHIAPELLEQLSFEPRHLFVYLVLGVLVTLVGWVYVKVFYGVESAFEKLPVLPAWARPGLGGLLLGALALLLGPQAGVHGVLFGGYGLMEAAIAGTLGLSVLLLLIPAKILSTSLTISSGGSGGVFAPALAIGALAGAAVGQFALEHVPAFAPHPAAVVLVAMGGFFAGVAKVPVASVVLVSEMTGGYELLAPLMLVSVVHIALSRGWTLYQAQVPSQIESPAHVGDYVVEVLQSVRVREVLEEIRPPRLIHEDVTLRNAKRIVADSHETHFPVVDDEDLLVGIFSLTDLRRIFLEAEVEDLVIVRDFMRDQVVTVTLETDLYEAQRLMTRRAVNALPVVHPDDPKRVVAMLQRQDIGRAYNERIQDLKGTGPKASAATPGA